MKPKLLPRQSDEEVPLELAIQRCVDGELTDADERSLLARLEFQPDGWRRLALTFVEHRLLFAVCRHAVLPAGAPACPSLANAPVRRHGMSAWRITSLAVAALLAFGLGRWTSTSSPRGGPSATSPTEAVARAREQRPAPIDVRSRPPVPQNEPTPAMFVSLGIPGSDAVVQVPVYEFPDDASAWQPFEERAVSHQVADQLRRAGYQVRSARHLLQAASPEGRPILLPLETVQVQPSRL